MNNRIQQEAEMQEMRHVQSIAARNIETQDEPSSSLSDTDTLISMSVLLLACVALATLAHVFVS